MSKKIPNLWIIDDDPMSSFYIKRLAELGELANIITIYNKAQGAIEYLLHHKQSPNQLPDIILLDIYMPDVDGWQFLQEFIPIKHSLSKEVNIYIISSSNHPRDISRAESIPEVKGFFLKPVTLETLKELAIAVKH